MMEEEGEEPKKKKKKKEEAREECKSNSQSRNPNPPDDPPIPSESIEEKSSDLLPESTCWDQQQREEVAGQQQQPKQRKASMARAREAREVFLKMEADRRVSRAVRTEWLLEHLGTNVAIEKQQQQQSRRGGAGRWKGISVCGLLAKDQPSAHQSDERLRIGTNTAVTFLANSYRVVFVLDLSPSSFVIDDLGCVLYTRLIEIVKNCLHSLAKKMNIPGASSTSHPSIWLSFCAFSPFLCFPEDNILLHGVPLREDSLPSLISRLFARLKHFIDALVLFAQPHMREWNVERRRSRKAKKGHCAHNQKGPDQQDPPPSFRSLASFPPVPSHIPLLPPSAGSDRGFIQSDWALIFMLRMGLISAQMMHSRSLANIVIVTDGVCGVFDQQALHGLLAQLRLHATACSFIQLRSASLRGPVLGHVGFPELFQFIASATLGTFLFEDQLCPSKDDCLDPIQRALLTWSFRKHHNLVTGGAKSPFGELRTKYRMPLHPVEITPDQHYITNLSNLLVARLREGYAMRQMDELAGSEHHQDTGGTSMLLIRLSLAWRPLISIEYSICAPKQRGSSLSSSSSFGGICQRKSKLHVEVYIEAQLHCSMANLLGERRDPGSLRSTLIGLSEADALLLHVNLFNSDPAYWDIPREVNRYCALFEFKRTSQRVVLAERYESLRQSKFISYWQPLSSIDEAIWERWMHTHSCRVVLAHDHPLPDRIFTAQSKGRFVQISAELAYNELHAHLKRWASFVLVRDQTYICLLHDGSGGGHNGGAESPTKKDGGGVPPDHFCLVHTSIDLPCVLIRLSFPGGASGQLRDEILHQLADSLVRLRIVREVQKVPSSDGEGQPVTDTLEVPSMCVVHKPFERILIRYRAIPRDLQRIVRIERTDSAAERRHQIVHNATAKFLSCRRQVWHFRGVFLKNAVPPLSALEFILQTLLRRRLNQGFHLANCRDGIVTLLRQLPTKELAIDGQMPALEQCVLFGPTMVENNGMAMGGEAQNINGGLDTTNGQRSSMNATGTEEDLLMLANGDKFGTMESSRSGTLQQQQQPQQHNMLMMMNGWNNNNSSNCCTQLLWAQLVAEVWSEPTRQNGGSGGGEGLWQSRKTLLAENALVIRALFTFDQLMGVCNSRLWVDKPFLMETATTEAKEDSNPMSTPSEGTVQFMSDPFDFGTLLQYATQHELMLLPAMGYAERDPHSLTRLSFLLKGLQQELAEFCDVCIELTDEALISSLITELKQYMESDWKMGREEQFGVEHDAGEGANGSMSGEKEGTNDDQSDRREFVDPMGKAFVMPDPKDQQQQYFAESAKAKGQADTTKSTLMEVVDDDDDPSRNDQKQQQMLISHRSTSVPLLSEEKPNAKGVTPTKLAATKTGPNRLNTVEQRRRKSQTPNVGLMLRPKDEDTLHKCSAPAPSAATVTKPNGNPSNYPLQKSAQTPAARALRVYAKRLNDWRLIVYVLAKDARMCRQMMPQLPDPCWPPAFPVLAFLCDKPRMAQHFVERGAELTEQRKAWRVTNFADGRKCRSGSWEGKEPPPMDMFFVSGSYAAANAGLLETDPSELVSLYLPVLDIGEHCRAVFEQQLFSRAFVATVYACLCQELHVPVPVLRQAIRCRCEQTNIEVGTINEILRDTCAHLARKAPRNDGAHNHDQTSDTAPPQHHSALASASSSSCSDHSPPPAKRTQSAHLTASSINRSSGEETLTEAEGQQEQAREGQAQQEDCRDQLDDFRSAFDQLLRRHHFYRVPGLTDYFFYWPQQPQPEYSLSSMILPGLEDYVQISIPTEADFASPPKFGAAPPAEVPKPETSKAQAAFSRHSSARNTSAIDKRTRKASMSATSMGGRRRHTNAMEQLVKANGTTNEAETVEQSIRSRCSRSNSTVSWELGPEEEERSEDSEKSSLAGDLMFSSESWPLFIQFSISIKVPNGQSESAAVEFIPNCVKQILERCSTDARQTLSESALNLDQLDIRVDMSVLTWSLQHPQGQAQQPHHFPSGDNIVAAQPTQNGQRPLDELFGASDGSEWMMKSGGAAGGEQPQHQSGDEIFERKVEMLRQIPAEERRLLRKLQRNVQKMLNTEHLLITSRAFESRTEQARLGTLLRMAQFIREEVESAAGAANTRSSEQTLARFEMCSKELLLVAEPEDGLRRLGEKLNNLPVDYCRLRELPVLPKSDGAEGVPFEMESLLDGTIMLFYACGVADLNNFARTRHESIRQIGHSFRRVAEGKKDVAEAEDEADPAADGEVASILAGTSMMIGEAEEAKDEFAEDEEDEDDADEEGPDEEEDEEEDEQGDGFYNSSTTADDGTIAELTMPLNDSADFVDPFLAQQNPINLNGNHQRTDQSEDGSRIYRQSARQSLFERKQLLHDFWLIVQVEDGSRSAVVGRNAMCVNIYFCQRSFLLHEQLFESACRLVEEQIRLVNQELLLERMHQSEECDQLLVGHDHAALHQKAFNHQMLIGLDSAGAGAASRSAQNVPGEALTRANKFAQRPSSLLMEGDTAFSAAALISHARINSLTYSDEEGEHPADELNELARFKFRPGHFACDMVWHHWFPIHPRLQPTRAFSSGGNDIGFKALRLGLEGLAVRNVSNMYVYKERNGNVVYMRLHATEESILGNIPGGQHVPGWEEEVRTFCPNCILLAVHGVRPPGEEITDQLRNVLQRRLNSRTLEEIQNALLKNAHIRLEWSDIKFIQREPGRPNAVFFFTVPRAAQNYLGSVKYYLGQQMLTFCISPKFREQSGATHHRGKYSGGGGTTGGGEHCFSGGAGTSRALSLAGTPTIEQQQQPQQSCWTMRGSAGGTERKDNNNSTPHQHSHQHTFVPFSLPNVPPNPPGYVPSFYLVNKPPGEGKRDTGIACLEVKLVDWEGGLIEQAEEGRIGADSHAFLNPGNENGRDDRMKELSKCVQIGNVGTDQQPAEMPSTCCALFQFNLWQNGNVGLEELETRLKLCVQQAICDLITEFGLLSVPLFDNPVTSSPIRSKASSFSVQTNSAPPPVPTSSAHQSHNTATTTMLSGNSCLKPSSSELLPILHQSPHQQQAASPSANEGIVPAANFIGSSAPIHSPVKPFAQQQKLTSEAMAPIRGSDTAQNIRHPMTMLGRQRQLQSPIPFGGLHHAQQQTPKGHPQQQPQSDQSGGEFLRADFAGAASQWFSHVIEETKGSPEMSHSIRKYQFRLDCDASGKKIVQVVEEKLAALLKSERLVICRNAPPLPAEAQPQKHLRTLRSFTSLLDPLERDLGRPVSVFRNEADDPLDLALIAFNEQLCQDTLRLGQDPSVHSANIVKLADHTQTFGDGGSSPLQEILLNSGTKRSSAQLRRAIAVAAQQPPEMDAEEEEARIWRGSQEPAQQMAFARRMSCVSSLGCWRNRASIESTTATAVCASSSAISVPSARSSSISKFLPCLKPFIPRQRLLYLLVHGETITLFMYNYTNDVVAKIREIVERSTFWHNARSRLLREIGLHKMGITHLSTLKSSDARLNPYMLLAWMDPETLVNNDYPVDSLTTPDFSNIPRIYAQLLLKLYRFSDPAFVAKGISPWPFEDQTQQMLALREDVRSMLNDHRLFTEVHAILNESKQQQANGREEDEAVAQQQQWPLACPSLPEEVLAQLIGRSHEVHFVMSPLLLFPSWRRKVAAIRVGAATDQPPPLGGAVPVGGTPCRKHSVPTAGQTVQPQQRKEPNGKVPKGTAVKGMSQHPCSSASDPFASLPMPTPNRCSREEEPCLARIQQMLIEDYVSYLRSIGLQMLHIDRAPAPISVQSAPLPHEHHLSSGSQPGIGGPNPHHSNYPLPHHPPLPPPPPQSPTHNQFFGAPAEVWLCRAFTGGILFVQLSFMHPFFCVQMFAFYAAPQLDEHLRPNQQQMKHCASMEYNVHSVRELEHAKNELIRQCHVHSFVYDFHLRIVARYLVGEKQVLFNPGYNTNAFLVDFLQYYACRPPHARNCIYEENVHCSELKVTAAAIWEHFLCNEQRFGWKVVRLKNLDSADEFMLIAKEKRMAFGLDYELIRVVINPTRGQREKEHQITLKLYILLVTEMTGPLIETESMTAKSHSSDPDMEQRAKMAPDGGEFTHFVAGSSQKGHHQPMDSLGQQNEDEQKEGGPMVGSPCSTLIGGAPEEEGEDNNDEEGGGGDEAEEAGLAAVPDGAEEAAEVEEATKGSQFASLAVAPSFHRRYPSSSAAPSSSVLSSRHSLSAGHSSSHGHRPIVPSHLAQPDYCYECVLAAATELRHSTGHLLSSASIGAAQRRRFCSGGVLMGTGGGGAGRLSNARMSLPPSRTSTASTTSSSAGWHMTKNHNMFNRQRSESSQLSTGSLRSSLSPSKKQQQNSIFVVDTEDGNTLTPANSLKGLSEWRANQQRNPASQAGLDQDWTTLFEEEQQHWDNNHGQNRQQHRRLAIQRIGHPRRHRKQQQQCASTICAAASDEQIIGHEKGAIVPAEQVTYLHYLSDHQRRLQILLEDEVRVNRLVEFVKEADSFCYVDRLWKSLLASRPFQLSAQRSAQSLFISPAATSSKTSDLFFSDASFIRHPTASSTSEMEPLDFDALLKVIGIAAVVEKEPRAAELLCGINWGALCRFLVQFYEGAKRCRYFENSSYSCLVVTNPQFLDSAALFRHNFSNGIVELFLMFKHANNGADGCWNWTANDSFASQAIRKLLEEIISTLCTFAWSSLLHNPPTLA